MIVRIFLSALLFYFSFPNIFNPHGFWPCAWVFAVPLLGVLEGASFKKRLAVGVVFGLIAHALVAQWLWPPHKIGTILLVLALSIQPIIFCVFYWAISRRWIALVYVPALWAVSEWLRTCILQGFCWSLGYTQSFHPAFIQSAAWTGSYGVAFIIMFVNHCLYQAWRIPTERKFYGGLALAVCAGTYALGTIALSLNVSEETPVTVGVIQPNITVDRKWEKEAFDENIAAQVALTERALASTSVDLILWPETAFPADVRHDRLWYPRMKEMAVGHQAYFLVGIVPVISEQNFNSALFLDPQGQAMGMHHKQFLVPLSEYTPPGGIFSYLKNVFPSHGFEFAPGDRPGIFDLSSSLRFGVMICSEICYPSLARRLSKEGIGFAVVLLNDGWFTQPAAIMMHAQHTIMRAVESGFDIVSAGNTGWTGRVNRKGIINSKEELPVQQESFGTFHVLSQNHPTVYARIGDFFAVCCLLFVIITRVGKILSRKIEHRRP